MQSVRDLSIVQSVVDRVWPIRRNPPDRKAEYITLGQKDDNDIVVPEYTLSTRHCAFYDRDPTGRLYLADLGSLNGTLYDGRKLKARKLVRLRNQTELTMGRLQFDYFTARGFLELLKKKL